jgi:hypothetical protein
MQNDSIVKEDFEMLAVAFHSLYGGTWSRRRAN